MRGAAILDNAEMVRGDLIRDPRPADQELHAGIDMQYAVSEPPDDSVDADPR